MIAECLMILTCVAGLDGGSDYVPLPRLEVEAIREEATAAFVGDRIIQGPTIAAANSLPVEENLEPPRAIPAVWERLAVCESGWYGEPRWDYNGRSGFDGGIQFHPNTWTAFKDGSDPDYAYQASPERQVEIGRRVAAAQGAGAWPHCTAKLGISTSDLLN